ncbi:MAG: YqaJ viral recombinase family protein [Treponemataceae bacterium]
MLYEDVIDMGNVSFTNTQDLSHEQWLELREKGIGGSDAGAICGLNKYATPLSVYFSKNGLNNFKGNKATEWGNILESPVREKAREDLGVTIETVDGMFTSIKYPFMVANLDGLVFVDGEKEISNTTVSGLGGHEIKTSRTGDGFTKHEIPDSYYPQVQHYMAVTGLKYFVLTVYIIDKYEGTHYVVQRNDVFIFDLIQKEKDFWENNIIANVMPEPTGNDYESKLVDNITSFIKNPVIELPNEYEDLIAEERFLAAQIKELETKRTLAKEKIKIAIFENSEKGDTIEECVQSIKAQCGIYKINWLYMEKSSVDTTLLKKAGIYDQYSKKRAERQLRITEGKA